MRSVHCTNAWHPSSGGVRSFYSLLLARAEARRQHMALVIPGEHDDVEHRGTFSRIYTIASPAVPIFDRRYRVVVPHRALPCRGSRIRQILDRERPDVVEVADKYTLCHLAGALKRQRGPRPTVIGVSHERLDDAARARFGRWRWAQAFARWYMSAVYLRQFDAHVANSEYTADELRAAAASGGPDAWRHWRLRDRIYVLFPGVDADMFRPDRRSTTLREQLLARAGGSPASILIVFAGRLSVEKYVAELVPALHFIVRSGIDARLVIVGEGPARSAVERDASAFTPGRCVLLGHLDTCEDLARVVASADIFLHPNPREPFGIGPLEAMASGVPLVVPRRGGVLSYASDETAWLAAPGAEGLARAVCDVVAAPDDARRRSANAVARAQTFHGATVADRYFDAFEAIDASRRSGWASGVSIETSMPLTIS